jgi:transaldolase
MFQPRFFLDTADVEYNKVCWDRFSYAFKGEELSGITTNPNAMYKVGVQTLSQFEKIVNDLCELVTNIRQDDKGVVFVQGPSSEMTSEQQIEFIKHIENFTDGHTKIGLKIPPFLEALRAVEELNKHTITNVTGLADCSNALRAISYGVDYISIIPGRMEENNINAKANISFVKERKADKTDIITGSMRTVEGLKWVIEYGTVPTIGAKVLDKIVTKDEICAFKGMWNIVDGYAPQNYSPKVTKKMIQLSVDFFKQMDKCGKPLFFDLFRQGIL